MVKKGIIGGMRGLYLEKMIDRVEVSERRSTKFSRRNRRKDPREPRHYTGRFVDEELRRGPKYYKTNHNFI